MEEVEVQRETKESAEAWLALVEAPVEVSVSKEAEEAKAPEAIKPRPPILKLKDAYEDYKDEAIHGVVDRKTYIRLVKDYLEAVIDAVLEAHTVVFPHNMGHIFVMGKKEKPRIAEDGTIRGLAPDWNSTLQLWKRDPAAKERKKVVFYDNARTNGYRYKYMWIREDARARYKLLYCLRMAAKNRQALSKKILAGQEFCTFVKEGTIVKTEKTIKKGYIY